MIVNLEQGSQEWLDYRRNKFNASETPILFGRGFSSVEQLANEKLGLRKNYLSFLDSKHNLTEREAKILLAVKKGQVTEESIRSLINKKYSMNFVPVVLMDDTDNRFSASLDGYDKKYNAVLEIKTSLNTYNEILKKKRVSDAYIYQCYHQLMVSGAKQLLFVAGYIDDSFELKLSSAILKPNEAVFKAIRDKWNAFERDYLRF